MDHFNYDDCKLYADRLRADGMLKTTGPYWPLLSRFVFMFDEITRLRNVESDNKKRIEDLEGEIAHMKNPFHQQPGEMSEAFILAQSHMNSNAVKDLRQTLSGDDDPGYQRYKKNNPNPVLSYIEWLQTSMQYLEEAAHAAVNGKNPAAYLATKAPTTLRDRIKELESEKRENDVIEIVTEFIKTQKECPHDAVVKLKNDQSTNRLWFEVLSEQVSRISFEPDTNSCDPVWNTFELISTNRLFELETEISDLRDSMQHRFTRCTHCGFTINYESEDGKPKALKEMHDHELVCEKDPRNRNIKIMRGALEDIVNHIPGIQIENNRDYAYIKDKAKAAIYVVDHSPLTQFDNILKVD